MGVDVVSIDGFECGFPAGDAPMYGSELTLWDTLVRCRRGTSRGRGYRWSCLGVFRLPSGLVGLTLTHGSLTVHRKNSRSRTSLREDLLMDKD